jgi:hypothetical protein
MPEESQGHTPEMSGEIEEPRPANPEPRLRWLFYGLGLTLQTFLWFLLFLAITVAVLVGHHLTEFRYVGF